MAVDGGNTTRTFLFTDIVSSTRMWENPATMAPALRTHDEIIRRAVAEAGALMFSISGDGFGAAFQHPEDAITTAVSMQRRLAATRWPHPVRIDVRFGIHLGPAEHRDGNFFGPPVNRSARVMAIAQAGQIVITGAVRDAVRDALPDDISLVPLGAVRLKDIPEPIEVYSVAASGVEVVPLPHQAPALAAGNLPARVATVVGRQHAVAEVGAALDQHRLVTLVGVGGVGKTTLAIDVGRTLSRFPDGVWLVKLGQIREERGVVGAIADALGVSAPGVSLDELIDSTLRARRLVLLVDNCEHVLEAVTEAVEAILGRTPNVAVLATSREPLRLPGERVVPVQPLSVHPPGDGRSDAADLFLRRSAESGVTIDLDRHGPAIDELCRRLDGLPLAIELAAAKARTFDPTRLVDLLDHRFQLLGGTTASPHDRHHTLRATFDWSYELLSAGDRAVFDRLGVMAGPFDLDDAIAICGDAVAELDVVSSLAALVDRSLVQRLSSVPPFRMLESLREFSTDRLVATGAESDVHRRHARHFRNLARELRETAMGPEEPAIAARISAQVNDFEAATRWAAANGAIEWALSIVVDLNTIGFQRGWRPAPTWLAELLADPPDPRPAAWADFLAATSATAANELGAVRRARELAHAALAIDAENPQALMVLSHLSPQADDCYEMARRARESALARGQLHFELDALTYQGFARVLQGETADALAIARELRRRGDASADRSRIGWSHYVMARALSATDPAAALVALEEARAIADEVANPNLEISSRRHGASTLILGEDPEAAEAAIASLLRRTLELGEIDHARRTCALAGMTRAMRGDDETAAVLIGRLGLPIRAPADAVPFRRIADQLTERLGDRHRELVARGRSMTVPQVIDLAVAALRRPGDDAGG